MKLIQEILPLMGLKPGIKTAGWEQDNINMGLSIICWPWLAFCMPV